MSDSLSAMARAKVSAMTRDEVAARRAHLEAKHAVKLAASTRENAASPSPSTNATTTKVFAAAADSDCDSPLVTLGALLERSHITNLTPAATVSATANATATPVKTPVSAGCTSCSTPIGPRVLTTGRRRLRRACLSPVHDDDADDGGGGVVLAAAVDKTTTSAAETLPPALNCDIDIDVDDDSAVCLSALKASFSAVKAKVVVVVVQANDDEGDDAYDFDDGWLVNDDEKEEEEEEEEEEDEDNDTSDDDASDAASNASDADSASSASATDNVVIFESDADENDDDVIIIADRNVILPPSSRSHSRLVSLPTHAPTSLASLRDGSAHPANGRIFIREEAGLAPLRGRGGSTLTSAAPTPTPARHSFRSRAARDALTLSLYAEYNATVFKNRLPPASMIRSSDYSSGSGSGAADTSVDLTAILIEWRGRLVKTAGLTFTRTNAATNTRCARVALSVTVLDSPARLATTLLHELCHAAAWVIDGVNRPPHGRVFNAWGALATAVYQKRTVTTCHSYQIAARFLFACDDAACGTAIGRHSKGSGVKGGPGGACKACGRGVMRLVNAAPPRTPSSYQAFLSRHRATVSAELGGESANPRLVLIELARRWGEEKSKGVGVDDICDSIPHALVL